MTQTIRKPLVLLLSVLLCFTLTFTALPATALAAEGDTGTTNGWAWHELADGTLEITGFSDPTSDISIPHDMDSKRVTAIAADAFSACTGLTTITFPNGLTTVGDNAFNGCTALTKVTIYSHTTTFGADVFTDAPLTDGIYGFDSSDAQTYAAAQSITFHTLHTVTFDSGTDGSVVAPIISEGGTITAPAAPTRTGYTFDHWYKENTFDTQWVFDTDTVASDITLYAGWTADPCIVTWDYQNSSANGTTDTSYDATLTKPTDPTWTGHTFVDWYTTTAFDTAVTFPYTVKGNATFYAKWTADPCVVTWDYQNSSANGTTDTSYDATLAKPANPTWTGHTFVDWYTTSSFDTAVTFPYTVKGNATFYARWTANPCVVTWNYKNSSANGTTNTSYDATLAKPANPTWTGHTFVDWYPTTDCDTTPVSFPYTVKGDVTFYAKWTTNGYIVTFHSQGGSAVASITVDYDSLIPPQTDPVWAGYTFRGWFKDSACTTPWNFGTDKVSGATDLYAKWQPYTANLTNITLTPSIALSPLFVKTKYTYKVTLPELTEGVTITPVKENDTAVMTIAGQTVPSLYVPVANGKSVAVKIVVTLTPKIKKTYTVTVTRPKSTNNYLASLISSAVPLSPSFDKGIFAYDVYLPEAVDRTTLTSAAELPLLAKVSPALTTVVLKNTGDNKTVKINVKSQAGKTRTYTVIVHRAPSTQVDMAYIKTSSSKYPLSPAFTAGTSKYTIYLPPSVSSITLSAKATGYNAYVTFNDVKKTSLNVKVGYGQTQYVTVKAISQSGTVVKSYNITITRMYKAGLYVGGVDIPVGEYFLTPTSSDGGVAELYDSSDYRIGGDYYFHTFSIFKVQSGQKLFVAKWKKGGDTAMFCPIENAPTIYPDSSGRYPEGMYKIGTVGTGPLLPAGKYRIVPNYLFNDGIGYVIASNSSHSSSAVVSYEQEFYSERTVTVSNGQYLCVWGAYVIPVP